jgi:hypothetical protein
MLNAQCSIFKGEKELRLTGLERIIEEKKCHKDSKGKMLTMDQSPMIEGGITLATDSGLQTTDSILPKQSGNYYDQKAAGRLSFPPGS